MFIPYSTDAPVYYWPYATIGLIVANVVAFVGAYGQHLNGNDVIYEYGLLHHGQGLNPLEWLTNMFMHANLVHLIGNMIFLWCFGLVVEGKVGWLRFLAIYLGIGIVQSALVQVFMLASTDSPGSLGASSAIYGIMAIALLWAPKNELEIFYWFGFFLHGTADVSIAFFALFYVCFDILDIVFSPGWMSTGFLHVTGALVGLPVGIAMLKLNWVDCEGFDIFHCWGGADPHAEPDYKKVDAKVAERKQRDQQQHERQAIAGLDQMLSEGHPQAALVLYHKLRSANSQFELTQPQLDSLVKQLHAKQLYVESAPFMADWVARFPAGTDGVRLKLAQICVTALQRPALALEMLGQIDFAQQPAEKRQLAKQILVRARKLEAEGVVELDANW